MRTHRTTNNTQAQSRHIQNHDTLESDSAVGLCRPDYTPHPQ